jgi:hypothetical protein
LKDHERNYVIHDLELMVIAHVLKMLRYYNLMGRKFKLRIFHSGMKYLLEKPTLNARQVRWLEFLCEYDFEITHITSKEDKVAIALSSRVHEMDATTISMYILYLKSRIMRATILGHHYLQVKERLQQDNIQLKFKDYNMEEDGVLLDMNKVYIPNSQELINLVLREMHNLPYAECPRYHKTFATLRSQYFWPIMKKEVIEYIARCMKCQKVKDKNINQARFLQLFAIPKWKWEAFTIYFITKLPKKMKQHDSIMVVVDKLTKDAHFVLVKLTHKVSNIAEIYMKEIARIHCVHKAIISNIDPKFTSNFWT